MGKKIADGVERKLILSEALEAFHLIKFDDVVYFNQKTNDKDLRP